MKYTIKSLIWTEANVDGDFYASATTSLGMYTIARKGKTWNWTGDFFDGDVFIKDCQDYEDGKYQAEQHNRQYVEDFLEEV